MVHSNVVEAPALGSNSQTKSYDHSLPQAGSPNLTEQLDCFGIIWESGVGNGHPVHQHHRLGS